MLRTKSGKPELQHFDDDYITTAPMQLSVTWSSGITVLSKRYPMEARAYFAEHLMVDYCDPKWGIYGGDGSHATHIIKKIRIASAYAEAAQ